jgi:hypothetical protein
MENEKQALLDDIVALFEESSELGNSEAAWRRRLAIRTELLLLCQSFADLHEEAPTPYWAAPPPVSFPTVSPPPTHSGGRQALSP